MRESAHQHGTGRARFRRWFEWRDVMPFAVDRTCGHIDRFVETLGAVQFGARYPAVH
jgi:hypothetical protein